MSPSTIGHVMKSTVLAFGVNCATSLRFIDGLHPSITNVKYAGIAQLVERNLAKVEVASSSLVSRSRFLDGAVAKRLCTGLQIRIARFDSGPRLHPLFLLDYAVVK
jgi:hypothetical protein